MLSSYHEAAQLVVCHVIGPNKARDLSHGLEFRFGVDEVLRVYEQRVVELVVHVALAPCPHVRIPR